MVVINVKKTDLEQFYLECRTTDSNDVVVREACSIHNLRDKVSRLAGALEELAKHGVMKPEAEKGLDELQDRVAALGLGGATGAASSGPAATPAELAARHAYAGSGPGGRGQYYCADPLGNRTGNAPPPNLQEVLRRTAADGMALVGREHFASGAALSSAALRERIDNMRGAVAMAFPMGVPENDTARLLLDDTADDGFLHDLMGNDFMEPDSASLWWAGKEFFRDQTVGDRVGKNEKTKVVARLQRKGGGAPVREPVVSEEERKAMMAAYFKKQEEEKALAEDGEDAYLGSSWADPKALKRSLQGAGGISFRPGMR